MTKPRPMSPRINDKRERERESVSTFIKICLLACHIHIQQPTQKPEIGAKNLCSIINVMQFCLFLSHTHKFTQKRFFGMH